MYSLSGCTSNKSADLIEFFRGQTVEAIQEAIEPTVHTFTAFLDEVTLHRDWVIKGFNESTNPVDYMAGCNDCEGALFAHLYAQLQIPDLVTWKRVARMQLVWHFEEGDVNMVELADSAAREYVDPKSMDPLHLVKSFVDFCGDMAFVRSTCKALEFHVAKGAWPK